MSTFLEQYHGVNPQAEGAQAVSYFWGLMTAGCLVGMILLKLIDSKRLLQVSGVLTIVLLLAALFGSKDVSLIAFPAIGFSISMMYSIVFSLALNSASRLICRNFMFGYRGWSRRADDCEYIGRCYVLAYRYAVYPALCGIYHLHRFLGTSADQQQDNQSERTLKKIR